MDKQVHTFHGTLSDYFDQLERARRTNVVPSESEEKQSLASEQAKDLASNRELREGYAERAFKYLVCWSVFTGATVCLSAWHVVGFNLSDTVLVTMLGTTLATAAGLAYVVAKGLFR